MAKWIRIVKETTGPNGKKWVAGKVILVGTEVAEKLVSEGNAEYSTGENELVEAIKKVKSKKK